MRRLLISLVFALPALAQDVEEPTRRQMAAKAFTHPVLVKGGSVHPGWLPDGGFWYARSVDGVREVIEASPEGHKPFFKVAQLRAALEVAYGKPLEDKGVPFSSFELAGGKAQFRFEGKQWSLDLGTYTVTELEREPASARKHHRAARLRDGFAAGSPAVMESASPDGSWFLGDDEENLFLRAAGSEEREPLTRDGDEDHPWTCQGAQWTSDGERIVVLRRNHVDVGRLPVVDWVSEPFGQVEFHPYTKAGGVMSRTELHVLDRESGEVLQLAGTGEDDCYVDPLGFDDDEEELWWLRMDRRYRELKVQASNLATGVTRTVLTETSETFIGALHYQVDKANYLTRLGEDRFLWISERDGWRHLYNYDGEGQLLGQLTRGDWEVERVVDVHPDAGWVYFLGHAEPNPYETHLYRVKLDGSGFARLSEGAGEHAPRFAPDHTSFVDVWSSPTSPPRSEYRLADGTLLSVLEEADVGALPGAGWRAPRPFVTKAADGATDLHGLLYVPYDFDPRRRYPVIDYIYNGPFTKWVPRTFLDGRSLQAQALAQLGFVVLIVDGRGTIGRGKAFQDVVYRNWGRNEIPDHAATLKQLARGRPWMDTTRVGMTGGSWGGYMTLRAILSHPDVYHVAVAIAAVADLYDHASVPIEGYMGLPEDDPQGYEYASCLRLADQLEGKLLIIHGTADVNATWSASMKMAHALVQAGKLHDFCVLPNADHWAMGKHGSYLQQLQQEYFIEHLRAEEDRWVSEH